GDEALAGAAELLERGATALGLLAEPALAAGLGGGGGAGGEHECGEPPSGAFPDGEREKTERPAAEVEAQRAERAPPRGERRQLGESALQRRQRDDQRHPSDGRGDDATSVG